MELARHDEGVRFGARRAADRERRHRAADRGSVRVSARRSSRGAVACRALTVSDRERSAASFAEHFGLTGRVHDDEHPLILGDGAGSLLALTEGRVPAPLPRTNHFGFQVARIADVQAARARFRAAGVTETEWQDDPGMVRVQVADPDGYRVEVLAIGARGGANPA